MIFKGYVFFNTKNCAIFSKWPEHKFVWLPNDGSQQYIIDDIISKEAYQGKTFKIERVFNYKPILPEAVVDIIELDEQTDERHIRLAFFAANDTIARSFLPLIRNLNYADKIVYVPKLTNENADKIFEEEQISFNVFSWNNYIRNHPDIIIFGNDWSIEPQIIISISRIIGIKSVCLQESIIDFSGPLNRMQWADFALVQGSTTVKELDRRCHFIVGNPRYDALDFTPSPNKPRALINCNFTYGIFEEIRESWLRNVTEVMEENKTDYFISQHPRDRADLLSFKNVTRSDARTIHVQLKGCSFIITRFSSVIHEALCLGKKVIYYNPHNEKMQYDFGFDGDLIVECKNRNELTYHVKRLAVATNDVDSEKFKSYLIRHCKLSKYKIYHDLHLFQYIYCLNGDGKAICNVGKYYKYLAAIVKKILINDIILRQHSNL